MSARRPWSVVDIELLRRNYADNRTDDIARVLGRPVNALYAKAHSLGLVKNAEYLAGVNSGRMQRGKQHPRMVATQFKRGHATWNKGMSYEAGGRSAETRFKPGRPAHEARNYVPIGSLRVSKDGYLERKVTDDPALYPARRWVGVHRLVWQAAHGPVPPGHIVTFVPGLRTKVEAEITLDRLRLISRAENARRNHPMAKSPELAHIVRLKGHITRQLNRITREAQEKGARP